MTAQALGLAAGGADLTACDREPIHAPGHIQPHGVLLATRVEDSRISHVSANLLASTGLDPARVLDANLADVLGAPALATIERHLLDGGEGPLSALTLDLPLPVAPRRNVLVHRHLGRLIVELEAPAAQDSPSVAMSQRIIAELSAAQSVEQLLEVGARAVRRLTQYDRVMVYRFDPEGHGVVVAEEKAEALEPFLGLRYPASDIPRQARRLYVLQRLRIIPEMPYAPVGLLGVDADAAPLDMTFCSLRGISPIHVEYMGNMGVCATMAISLIRDEELWGLIVCHHHRPKAPDPSLRELCGLVGHLMSVLLRKASDTASLGDRLKRHHIVVGLAAAFERAENVTATMADQGEALLALMGAGGALINIGGRGCTVGAAPPLDRALDLVSALRCAHGEGILAVADAGAGVGREWADVASGVLVMPIPNKPDDVIAWFRPEQKRTVRWGGNPNKPDEGGDVLTPRKSFAAWAEIVCGRSEPWTANDTEAAGELQRLVTGILLSQAERQLAQLSAYDTLTALANRRTLKARMDGFIASAEVPAAAMLFLDLDRFKGINDVLGHLAGDQVLIEVAARLRRLIPEGALAGRLGGDEFVVFLPGAGRAEAEALAQRLIQAMAEPFFVADQSLRVAASIGVAWSDSDGGIDRLMQQADEAMYAAKRRGGANVATFHPVLHAEAFNTLRLEQDLFRALEGDQITVHYQPIVCATGRSMVGFEALARWRHPERGFISPSEFIPVAEESGLISRFGAKVMASAVRQIAQWLQLNGDLRMSVNISTLQLFDWKLIDLLKDLLRDERVSSENLHLEVTESVLMQENALAQLRLIRGMGVKIAMDDFGTGYSSLAYLADLPVDIVKIDRKFVQQLGTTARADGVFAGIVSLAHTLGFTVIAEGCETEEQLRVIRESGCDGVQGWLLGKAAPPEEITLRLLQRSLGAPGADPVSIPEPLAGTGSR